MRLNAEIRYDADPQAVFAMICQAEFQERKCAANGAISYQVDISPDDTGAVVTTHRELPTAGVPDFVRSLVGPTLRVTQVDRWGPAGPDGSRRATTSVQIDGAPVRFSGTLHLHAEGAGSVQAMDGELKASVPLVGSRIEKAAEPAIRAAVRAEQRTATDWLARG
jgi:hypothetical protein